MSVEMIDRVYGHHHPEHLRKAANAIGYRQNQSLAVSLAVAKEPTLAPSQPIENIGGPGRTRISNQTVTSESKINKLEKNKQNQRNQRQPNTLKSACLRTSRLLGSTIYLAPVLLIRLCRAFMCEPGRWGKKQPKRSSRRLETIPQLEAKLC